MRVAIPRECAPAERRVAAIPATVKTYVRGGLEVVVEAGAGLGAFISDEEFVQAGARIEADPRTLFSEADLIAKVGPPILRPDGLDELAELREGGVFVSLLEAGTNPQRIRRLAERKVTAFAMEAVPRITRAQSLDALSSQATIAGYKAVILAANALERMMPMMMTAAGTIQPANVLIIGAGVAGLQAVATARRMGGRVKAVDTRPVVEEQVHSLGAQFVHLNVQHEAQTSQGYAVDLGEDFYRGEQEIIAPHLADSDIVITTALVPGRRAPILITSPMVDSMRGGSVIVDLAIAAGGNCVLARPDEEIVEMDVRVLAPTNLPSMVPIHASQLYSRNIAAFVNELVKDGQVKLDLEDEILRSMLMTHAGEVRHEPTRKVLEKEASA